MSNTRLNASRDGLPNSSRLIVLNDRAVIALVGADAERFINDLLTNAVPSPDVASLTSAALLSPQGKIQFDVIVHAGGGRYLLDVARDRCDALIKRLNLYKLRANLTLDDQSSTLQVVVVGDSASLLPDPRLAALPRRGIRAAANEPPDRTHLPEEPGAYHASRIELGVPEAGQDYVADDVFPHEALLDQLHGVDFGKGCYVGQEIVSRMQHRGTARSRFIHVRGATELPPMGSEIRAGDVPLGVMGSHSGTVGLALIRLDRLAQVLANGAQPVADGVALTCSKPAFGTFGMTGAVP
jgi:tRNA-modifying protein YgfZ